MRDRRRLCAAFAASLAAVLLALNGGTALAQTASPSAAPKAATVPAPAGPGSPGGPRLGNLSAIDRNFVVVAASAGMLEVDASRLALDRARNGPVRAFAQHMLEEHGALNDELRSLAKGAGMGEVPAVMLARHAESLDRLRALNGAEFDREYVARIGIATHVEATALFDKASHAVANAALRSFAAKTLPALRDHLRQAQALAKGVAVPLDRLKEANAPVDIDLDSPTGLRNTPALGDVTGRHRGAGSPEGTPDGASRTKPASGTAARPSKSTTDR